MSITKNSKMLQFVNYRMRVTLDDKRTIIGRFLAFDKHMNLVLADSEETRRTKGDVEERRALGLVLIRGECVVSLAIESPPVSKGKDNNKVPGSVRAGTAPFGRGVPLGMTGITAPMPGLSAPSPALAPQSANMSTFVTPPPPGFTPAPPGM